MKDAISKIHTSLERMTVVGTLKKELFKLKIMHNFHN